MRILNADQIDMVPIDNLTTHPANPNRGDIEAIRTSIEADGFYGAVVAQRSTGHILVGNHRYQAAWELQAKAVPTIWVDCDDQAALRILLKDNRHAELGQRDPDSLVELLRQLDSTDQGLLGTGYDGTDLQALVAQLDASRNTNDGGGTDQAPDQSTQRLVEFQAKWDTEPGQVWVVNDRHRLLCGDSTDPNHVQLLLDGARPTLCVTDQPYGVDYDPAWRNESLRDCDRRTGVVENDDTADWYRVWELAPCDVVYTWYAVGLPGAPVQLALESAGYVFRSQIIWAKAHMVLGRGHYHWQHEHLLYFVRKGATANWIGDRSQTTLWDDIASVGSDPTDPDLKTHSTQKPLECMARPIRHHAGDVYDPFAGSGTILVAADRLGRSSYHMEINPQYVALILERCQSLGLDARRV